MVDGEAFNSVIEKIFKLFCSRHLWQQWDFKKCLLNEKVQTEHSFKKADSTKMSKRKVSSAERGCQEPSRDQKVSNKHILAKVEAKPQKRRKESRIFLLLFINLNILVHPEIH